MALTGTKFNTTVQAMTTDEVDIDDRDEAA